jgi:hypothetical protein
MGGGGPRRLKSATTKLASTRMLAAIPEAQVMLPSSTQISGQAVHRADQISDVQGTRVGLRGASVRAFEPLAHDVRFRHAAPPGLGFELGSQRIRQTMVRVFMTVAIVIQLRAAS